MEYCEKNLYYLREKKTVLQLKFFYKIVHSLNIFKSIESNLYNQQKTNFRIILKMPLQQNWLKFRYSINSKISNFSGIFQNKKYSVSRKDVSSEEFKVDFTRTFTKKTSSVVHQSQVVPWSWERRMWKACNSIISHNNYSVQANNYELINNTFHFQD